MIKIILYPAIVLIAIIFGGIYGMLDDQLSYSISSEYYTKFKFIQFGLVEDGEATKLPNSREYVAIVGWMATWWMGIPVGILLASVNIFQPGWRNMCRISIKALLFTLAIAFIIGLAGLLYGQLNVIHRTAEELSNWYIPDNLINRDRFLLVGSMHNFGYCGGLIGLVCSFIYSANQMRNNLRINNSTALGQP